MDRRTFIGSVAAGLLAVPLAARAQQSAQVYRIGFLRERTVPADDAFVDAMRKLGWIEGQNFKIEPRYADDRGRLPMLATELVQLNVDLIITIGTPATRAAKQATTTIPIVFVLSADPVQNGIVVSLARPGGNLTGFSNGLYGEKMLEVLKAALPGLSRVAVPLGSESPAISSAARLLGMQVLDIEMRGPEEYGAFFAGARKAGADAALIPDSARYEPHLQRIAAEATRSRLPSIGWARRFAESEGLLSYGPKPLDSPRLAARIDKIFKGAKPGDLPVELPTRFELVINLKTAKTLGLTIPQSLLLRADDLIQ